MNVELTYHRVRNLPGAPDRIDAKVGSMLVGCLRVLPYYGEPGSVGRYDASVSWALYLHFTPEEVAFITKSINDEATMRNVTLRLTS